MIPITEYLINQHFLKKKINKHENRAKNWLFFCFYVVNRAVDHGSNFLGDVIGIHTTNSYLCQVVLYHVLFTSYREKNSKIFDKPSLPLWSPMKFFQDFYAQVKFCTCKKFHVLMTTLSSGWSFRLGP